MYIINIKVTANKTLVILFSVYALLYFKESHFKDLFALKCLSKVID